MLNNIKFPPTVESKRAIAATERAGIVIGSVEIHPRKITIHSKDAIGQTTPMQTEYQIWKAGVLEIATRVGQEAEKPMLVQRNQGVSRKKCKQQKKLAFFE